MRILPSQRKLRLFACACCRRIWAKLPDTLCQQAVALAELVADGLAPPEDLDAAWKAGGAFVPPPLREDFPTATAFRKATKEWNVAGAARSAAFGASFVSSPGNGAYEKGMADYTAVWARHAGRHGERKTQADIVRCLSFNPFRISTHPSPAILDWNDRTIPRIAQAIYEERQLPEGTLDTTRLAILADALMDAGCGNEELIAHCRSEGPHVRGCWAIDLILGKA
jgi:hypothetical protein